MGLFSHKGPTHAHMVDRTLPHDYRPPALPPASGRIACLICGQGPDDPRHDAPVKVPVAGEQESQSEFHWSS